MRQAPEGDLLVTALGKLSRQAYKAHRLERAVNDPGRYAKNRAVSKGLGVLGFWRLMRRVWR